MPRMFAHRKTIEILGATYTRSSMFEKREKFFSADLHPIL
jgi:hypothetical protein